MEESFPAPRVRSELTLRQLDKSLWSCSRYITKRSRRCVTEIQLQSRLHYSSNLLRSCYRCSWYCQNTVSLPNSGILTIVKESLKADETFKDILQRFLYCVNNVISHQNCISLNNLESLRSCSRRNLRSPMKSPSYWSISVLKSTKLYRFSLRIKMQNETNHQLCGLMFGLYSKTKWRPLWHLVGSNKFIPFKGIYFGNSLFKV